MEETLNGMYTSIEEFAVKRGKAMIDGKVKFRLVVIIITLVPLTPSGMLRQFMVSLPSTLVSSQINNA
jgi:hypothetical protein